jgi:hypothetical protein
MAGMVSENTGRRVFLRVFVVLFALSSGSDVGGGVSMGSGAVAAGSDVGGDSSSLIAGVAILRFDFRFIPECFIHAPFMLLSTRFFFYLIGIRAEIVM